MSEKKLYCKLSVHTLQNSKAIYSENFTRILGDSFPEGKYRPRTKNDGRTTVHFGQRKLFLSEVEFLTNVCRELPPKMRFKKIVVIYAGAAPGNHIGQLSEMFPFVRFVLVDPAKYVVEENERLIIKQEMFTNVMALDLKEEYEDYVRVFISDIRRFGPGMKMDDNQIEKEVN